MSYVSENGTVLYRSNLGHGKNKHNVEFFTAEESIAATTQHILPKAYQMVRYYAWYSNRAFTAG
jgi:hypothetical protein